MSQVLFERLLFQKVRNLNTEEKENLFVALYESASRDESNEPFPASTIIFFCRILT